MIEDEDYAYEQKRQRKIDELAKSDFVVCPVCNGECGINVTKDMRDENNNELASDWFDCDNCDALGFIKHG